MAEAVLFCFVHLEPISFSPFHQVSPRIAQVMLLIVITFKLLVIKHLMTGPKRNSEFCFPETSNV